MVGTFMLLPCDFVDSYPMAEKGLSEDLLLVPHALRSFEQLEATRRFKQLVVSQEWVANLARVIYDIFSSFCAYRFQVRNYVRSVEVLFPFEN